MILGFVARKKSMEIILTSVSSWYPCYHHGNEFETDRETRVNFGLTDLQPREDFNLTAVARVVSNHIVAEDGLLQTQGFKYTLIGFSTRAPCTCNGKCPRLLNFMVAMYESYLWTAVVACLFRHSSTKLKPKVQVHFVISYHHFIGHNQETSRSIPPVRLNSGSEQNRRNHAAL